MFGQTRRSPFQDVLDFQPRFLDLDRATALHRHCLLELTLPLDKGVTPHRVPIEGVAARRKQFTSA
jgi:hypothetical protein